MATVYSNRFMVGHGFTGSDGVVVADGFRAIARDLDGYLTANTLDNATLTLHNSAGGVLYTVEATAGSSQVVRWTGRQVYDEGEVINLLVSDGLADYALSGYLLTLP